jgi:hypothetical protein
MIDYEDSYLADIIPVTFKLIIPSSKRPFWHKLCDSRKQCYTTERKAGCQCYEFPFVTQWLKMSRDSAVGIATYYALDGRGSIPNRGKKFSPLHSLQTDSGTHTGPILVQWIPRVLIAGVNSRSVKLTTHLHLVPRSRMVELSPLPHRPLWRGA